MDKTLERLFEELNDLIDMHLEKGEYEAITALESVKWWAMEESVECVE